MQALHIIFYFFAAIAVFSAFGVIVARNSVRSALSLVVTFFAMGGIWMILRAEFLSLILLLVYVGAVMTLFLFVVMMINVDHQEDGRGFVRYLPFGIVITLLLIGLLVVAVKPSVFGFNEMPVPAAEPANFSNVKLLGQLLFSDYAYPFEIAGVLLLAAIIASITLAHRGPIRRRVQFASEQISVRPEDRLRMIKMPPEKKPRDKE